MSLKWRIAWLLTYPLAKLFLKLEVKGREWLSSGAQIIAANHTSNFDPLIIGWATAREIFFLAKEELFRYRPFAYLIKSWNAIPIQRKGWDLKALRECERILNKNKTLVLFPEGTRSKTGELGVFKPGIGLLAINNQVPVVPVFISGLSNSIISYWVDKDLVQKGWRKKPAGLGSIKVTFSEPILPTKFERSRKGYETLTRMVEERIKRLADLCRR